jgi:7-cyano-7-deazaguanine synthase
MSDETSVENLERIINEKESESVVKEKVVILFSGGSDSTLLMKFASVLNLDPVAVLVDYGQLHVEELSYAETYCKNQNIPYKRITIQGYDVKSGLTSGDKNLYQGVHSHNVPARNSIMLSLAAGIAESINACRVWYGPDFSDREGLFPDCYQNYVFELNKTFAIAFSYPIKVEAPLLGFSKAMVLSMLENQFGIKSEDLYTGYREFA